tara:strand:- start:161 stop:1390 length:1230 start_codon:yes stop_codon:yes gene_type:complete
MATPTPTVEIGFIGPSFDNAFTLDDAVKGKLDSVDYVLSGTEVMADLTDRCVSFVTRRGRLDWTQPFSPGMAKLLFRNIDGALDPLNTSSAYYPGITVGRTVTIKCNGHFIYSGLVEDISLGYDTGGDAWVTVIAEDQSSELGLRSLTSGTSFSEQTSGPRVSAVLANANIGYAGATSVAAGSSTVAAETLSADVNAVQYLQKVSNSEQGYLYVNRSGVMTFEDRYGPLVAAATVTFSDDGSDTPYQSINRNLVSAELFNRLTANRTGAAAVTANETDSQDSYGIRLLPVGEVLVLNDATVTNLLDFLMVQTASTDVRINSLTAVLDTQSSGTQNTIAQLELADAVDVEFTPPGVAQQSTTGTLQEIGHAFTVGETWRVTLGMTPKDMTSYLLLDNATLGRLDHNSLGF